MAYATVSDLEARWRTLSESEAARAAVLLDDAAVKIDEAGYIDPNDSRKVSLAKIISCDMVKRAMNAPLDQPALSQ